MLTVEQIKENYIVLESKSRYIVLDKDTEEYLCYFKVITTRSNKTLIQFNDTNGLKDLEDLKEFIDYLYNNKFSNPLIDKYVIIKDLALSDYCKEKDNSLSLFNSKDEACTMCGMMEIDGALVLKIEYQHKE